MIWLIIILAVAALYCLAGTVWMLFLFGDDPNW
jgi:hypothetical protein